MRGVCAKFISRLSSPRFYSVAVDHHHPTSQQQQPCLPPRTPLTKPQLTTIVLDQYARGKFSNLLLNVVSNPSVLLTACHNLIAHEYGRAASLSDSVSKRFSIDEMSREIREDSFGIEASCLTMRDSRKGGECLVLPDLKLKVLMEAIRMVLEVVYDERFATFAYGGRVGMGRHTAVRYLKNTVENPSWWFTVQFGGRRFDLRHVDKLCMVIQEKIDDVWLIRIVKRLFECEVVQIELGALSLGRGFPLQSGLSSILLNIFFDGFDKEMQELRLQFDKENPKVNVDELVSGPNVFHKRSRIYFLRYLDEILVITSGPKALTLNVKNRVLKLLEQKLDLEAGTLRSVIHSAVSEKLNFFGMELQAVLPSVLHPPLSEKAIRARKKYEIQKAARLAELKNAKETNRKKLGLKIFNHVFKKLKRGSKFNFDFHIENEVRDIFSTWGDEVVKEFFASLEVRYWWHRQLSVGNFLSLPHIRDQLPHELVDSYDNFQNEVDKHLNPIKVKDVLEAEERMSEEERERKYAKRTVEDLTKYCMKVSAPIDHVRKAVRLVGFTNKMGRPRPISLLTALEDADIIKWYAGVGRRWLDFFCCCRNFSMVKTVVTYHLRFSCILTLAEKHESTKREAIRHYTKDLKILDADGTEEVHFPSEREIKMMGDKNLSDPKPVDGAIAVTLIRLASDDSPYACAAHFCDRGDTILYRICLLQERLNVNPADEKNWVPGMGAIHGALNRKCIPLCADHISALYLGSITFQDMDYTSFVNIE
uniref:Domain X domain-containing protein n=1 Tax=Kalanchoe fedtschenkoi TaxID=63787 RepID=A0A7N0SX43_KALFE